MSNMNHQKMDTKRVEILSKTVLSVSVYVLVLLWWFVTGVSLLLSVSLLMT